jgi:hypothetical protein
MLTGICFHDENGESWFEKTTTISAYSWMFNNGNGTGCCLIFTYD